jgi:hypothetical protein
MGEGERDETVVQSAVGGGNDGIGADGTLTGTPDGRHFKLGGDAALGPLVPNRSRILRSGIPQTILEEPVDDTPFDPRYQIRLDLTTGVFELQGTSFVDQGGKLYKAALANVGDGYIGNLSLIDVNAPAETWTIRCVSARRDGYGNPIDGYSKFAVRGSVSGTITDGYGNAIVWTSNGATVSNGILSFGIFDGTVVFREGDSFIIQTQGGPLRQGESLTANYIAYSDINDPEFFEDINKLKAKHGQPSAANRLSLGAQIAFANGTPGVYALQCAPSLPRRKSYTLVTSANGQTDIEELTFDLPLGVLPDANSNISFFVKNPITKQETQILPNKYPFYNPTVTANPSTFVFGQTFSYTVVLEDSVQKEGNDGVLTVTSLTEALLASNMATFGIDDLEPTRSVTIVNAANPLNNGTFAIVGVIDGKLKISNPGGFVNETGIEFQVTDSADSSARILFTVDLALSLGQGLRCSLVDAKDADFYDAGWVSAYEAAEKIDIDMVVPLPSQTISAIFQNGKSHVISMSQIKNKRERVLMIGAIKGLTPDNVIGNEPAAVEDLGILEGIQGDDINEILAGDTEDLTDYGVQASYGDTFRVFYYYPDEIRVQAGASNIAVDGFFMAAAAAGAYAGNNLISLPQTNTTLGGFTIDRSRLYSPIVTENIVAAGITLLQPVSGGGNVIWSKTTTLSGAAEEEEQSIVFIRDRIAKDMRVAFRPFVGKTDNRGFIESLYAQAVKMAQSLVSRQLITDFKDIRVERDSVEPRQFNITLAVQPVYPVLWIYVRVDIGLL